MAATLDSNKTSLTFAEETSLKVLPVTPTWYPLEPNSYANFGGNLKTTSREPINATRQKAKGTITDLDVTAGFNTDWTQTNLTRLLQGFFFATAHEKAKTAPLNGTQVPVTAVATTGFSAASGLGGFKLNHIVKSTGFTHAANNTLSVITTAGTTTLAVSPYIAGGTDALVVESAPPAAAALEAVGFALHGDVKLYGPGSTFGGTTVVNPFLSSAADVDFTTLGLLPGEWVYLGDATDTLSDTSATEYNFIGTGTVRNRGYCRVLSVTATALTFDLAIGSAAWALSGSGDGSVAVGASGFVSLYFGTVIRNEPVASNILRRTYTLQRYLGKNAANTNMLEYISGSVPNELTLNVPANNKLAADLTFVGMDTQQSYAATLTGTYATGPLHEDPYNTSQDVYAMLLYITGTVDSQSAPLFAYASDNKLTLNNNTKPDKAIGVVGAFEASTGNFDVSGSLTCFFPDIASQQAVRNNTDVGLTNIFAKQNAGMILDLPVLTLGLNGLKVEKDKPIMADITQSASASRTQNYTMLYCNFAYLPASAMASYKG